MQNQPLFSLGVGFILGIFFQDLLLLKISTVYILLISGFLLLSLFFIKNFYIHRLRSLFLLFLFFTLGVFAHFLHSQKPELPDLKGKEIIIFKIVKKLNSNEKNRRYEIIAWKDKSQFNSILSLPKTEMELDFSHYYKAEAFVNKFEKPYSDFQFDYGKYLARKDIYFQSYLPNSLQKSPRNDLSFPEKIKEKRLETLRKIDHSKLSKSSREFTKGIILADRTEMDKDIVQDFSRSGLAHILAISGAHMAIIFWLILLVLTPIFPPKIWRFKIFLSLLLIWSFAIFIDYGNSVVRSCVMISAYYIFVLLQRKTDLLQAMALAAFAILIWNTNQVFDVGFQLSFTAVLGIFWLNQPILKIFSKPKNKFQNFMMNIVSVSFAAQIATLPLVIYYFHQYSFSSIIANLVVIPFSEILIIFSLIMTLLLAFSLEFFWLDFLYDAAVSLTLNLIHFFADIDFTFHQMIPMTLLEVLSTFLIIYFLRTAILKFNIKNAMKLIYFILLFIILRLVMNYRATLLNEILVHRYFKEKIISVKKENQVQFIMQENSNQDKIEKYIISPYLTSRRIKKFEIIQIPRSESHILINGKKILFD